MNQPLPRFHRHTLALQDAQRLGRILIETGQPATTPTVGHATAGGDERRLRGIPCIARGVAGAVPGTSPHHTRMDNIRWP